MDSDTNQGLFAVNGDSNDWQANFQDGKFVPVVNAHQLTSQQVSYGPNVIHVHRWCGHGSIFTWNPSSKGWDEFDLSVKKVTCTWFKKGSKPSEYAKGANPSESDGLFSVDGNNQYFIAYFESGEFKPVDTCKSSLSSDQVVSSSNFTYVRNWCGHGSIFMFNPKKQGWDEFDVSQNKVTCTWLRCDDAVLQQSLSDKSGQDVDTEDKSYADNEGYFAIDGNSSWQAYFKNGKFTPANHCAGNLSGGQTSSGPNFIQVYNWCGHGSLFTWNPSTQSWDEFDQDQNKVTCKWYKMQGHAANEEPLYAPGGDPNNKFKAYFIKGKFTPKGQAENFLHVQVISETPTYCIAPNWCGHPSIFMYNPKTKGYDEYDVSQKKVTTRWLKINGA